MRITGYGHSREQLSHLRLSLTPTHGTPTLCRGSARRAPPAAFPLIINGGHPRMGGTPRAPPVGAKQDTCQPRSAQFLAGCVSKWS